MSKLTENIKEQMQKHRYRSHHIDEHLNLAKGTFSVKLRRCDNDMSHGINARDISGLCILFKCQPTKLFQGVKFNEVAKDNK